METRIFNRRKPALIFFTVLMLSYVLLCMTRNCFSSAMVFIVDEGLLTDFQTGVIIAVFYVVYALLQVVGGLVTDKLNPERFVTIGLIGAAISNFVIFFNQNYIVMLVAWSFNAAMQFGVWPAVFKIVSTMFEPKMSDNALFAATLGSPGGIVLSYAVAAIVGSFWQLNFIICAVGLVFFAIVWEITAFSMKPYMEVKKVLPEPQIVVKRTDVNFGRLAIRSGLMIVMITAFIRTMFDYGIKGYTPTMINTTYDAVSPILATVMNIAVLIAGIVGTFIAHVIYPKHIRNESVIVAAFFVLALPLSIAALGLGTINYWVMIVILSFIIMFMGGSTLFTTTYMAARFNKYGKGATVAGIMNCTSSLGIVLANVVFPAIAGAWGWNATVIMWVIMMAVAVACTLVHLPIWTKFLKAKE